MFKQVRERDRRGMANGTDTAINQIQRGIAQEKDKRERESKHVIPTQQ